MTTMVCSGVCSGGCRAIIVKWGSFDGFAGGLLFQIPVATCDHFGFSLAVGGFGFFVYGYELFALCMTELA